MTLMLMAFHVQIIIRIKEEAKIKSLIALYYFHILDLYQTD